MSLLRRLIAPMLALALLSGCTKPAPKDARTLRILATTYPVYLFTTAVTEGIDGVEVTLLVNSQTSCLHDYTLTVADMKAIDQADVIVMNGAGLEDFMADALLETDAWFIDCSQEITLLPTLEHAGHDGHDHEEEYDPHYWMDPSNASEMADCISSALSHLLNDTQRRSLMAASRMVQAHLSDAQATLDSHAAPLQDAPFIPFHNGFQYFADAFGLNLLKSIEEEEGATASAAEIKEIAALIEEYQIPAIFVEKNGSDKTARVIESETGCRVYELDMLMSGDGTGIQPYIDAMGTNLTTLLEALT